MFRRLTMDRRGGQTPMLIILSGLPGVGKTSIARELARRTGATHIRIDSIEQAIRASGLVAGSLDDVGYRVGYAVAEDNLRLGRTVIADSVNPLPITREAWREVAERAGAGSLEVEVICSDASEHQRRVETRPAEPGSSAHLAGCRRTRLSRLGSRSDRARHRERQRRFNRRTAARGHHRPISMNADAPHQEA